LTGLGHTSAGVRAALALSVLLWVIAYTGSAGAASKNSPTVACRDARLALQIPGSSGPLNAEGRASTSYVLWHKSRPAIVVDLGAGSVANLVRAGSNLTEIEALLISHIHPDHVSDLPGLLWDEDILGRANPLLIVGPTGSGDFPDVRSFLDRLFGATGAFAFMHGLLDSRSKFHLDIKVIDTSVSQRVSVADLADLEISAYPVAHGKAPSLAYRIDAGGFSVVFGGDQSGTDVRFATFAKNADVLVLHTALSRQADGHPFAKVIGLPQSLGALAAAAGAKRVVLSHLMALPIGDPAADNFSLADREALIAAVQSVYRGEVTLASDLLCIGLAAVSKEQEDTARPQRARSGAAPVVAIPG
jgi:ribonuclease Z